MKPGDRIELIKKLAQNLGERDWQEVDLIFRQFGLPWSNVWYDPDLYAYAINHLERGGDTALIALYEYLFPGQASSDSSALNTEGPWEPGRFRLFLSHISDDKLLVKELKDFLAEYAIDGFVAHEDIEPTKEWAREIATALDTCHALAAILTPNFHRSNWTDQEVGYCIKRRVLILPVMRGAVPYGFMGPYQGLRADRNTPREIAADMLTILIEHDTSSGQMASALVSYFEISPSYDETRRRMDLIQRIKTWTPDLLQRLESSIERNSEIRDCSYRYAPLPPQLRALVERHSKGS